MKTISEVTDEVVAEGVEPEDVRKTVTERLRDTLRSRIEVTGPPNPAIMAGVGQEHLGALFAWVISLIYASASDEELERVLAEFEEFRDFDITARQYQAFVLGYESRGSE